MKNNESSGHRRENGHGLGRLRRAGATHSRALARPCTRAMLGSVRARSHPQAAVPLRPDRRQEHAHHKVQPLLGVVLFRVGVPVHAAQQRRQRVAAATGVRRRVERVAQRHLRSPRLGAHAPAAQGGLGERLDGPPHQVAQRRLLCERARTPVPTAQLHQRRGALLGEFRAYGALLHVLDDVRRAEKVVEHAQRRGHLALGTCARHYHVPVALVRRRERDSVSAVEPASSRLRLRLSACSRVLARWRAGKRVCATACAIAVVVISVPHRLRRARAHQPQRAAARVECERVRGCVSRP
mmetsp:Transcript_1882/g.7558  ORF Transcript_1882/g.7558 Transcript_1882/m.7558 type:complete len:297 (+) Transcript_1882:3101-3991(+)